MVWCDFKILQFLIVENTKNRINFNTGCVTNLTFQEVGSNCGIFKQVSENSSNEFRSTCSSKDVAMRICLKKLKIEQPVTFEGPRSWQCNYLYKSFGKWTQSTYSV